MVILKSLQSILSIVIMISLGYYLTHREWFDENSSKLLAKIVTTISLPAMMISNLLTNFNKDKLYSSGEGLLVPLMSILITFIISTVVSRIIRVVPSRRGVFQSMFFISNSVFIGLPVNLALFGEVSTPYVLLYYIANTIFFWTLGVYGISKYGSENKSRMLSLQTVKRIFSPPLLGFLAGIILILMDINPPSFIMDTCKYLGNMTTPISMLFIGTTLYFIDLKKIRPSIDMAALLIGRFVISPLMVIGITHFIPIPTLMKNVFVIQASMPVMTQTAIISKTYNSDHEYAAVMIAVTTIASIFFIPFYMALL